MISSWSVVCLLLSLGVAHSWFFTSVLDDETYFNGLARFNEINQQLPMVQQQVQQMADSVSSRKSPGVFSTADRNKLDAVEPKCTTTMTNSASIAAETNPRLNPDRTQTTTCIRELVSDGKRYISTETKTTDSTGALISENQSYQMFVDSAVFRPTAVNTSSSSTIVKEIIL